MFSKVFYLIWTIICFCGLVLCIYNLVKAKYMQKIKNYSKEQLRKYRVVWMISIVLMIIITIMAVADFLSSL